MKFFYRRQYYNISIIEIYNIINANSSSFFYK